TGGATRWSGWRLTGPTRQQRHAQSALSHHVHRVVPPRGAGRVGGAAHRDGVLDAGDGLDLDHSGGSLEPAGPRSPCRQLSGRSGLRYLRTRVAPRAAIARMTQIAITDPTRSEVACLALTIKTTMPVSP